MAARLSTFQSLKRALKSKRLGVVTLMSFASGLPLGLVWIAVPVWLRDIGVDIRIVGLTTLFQAPWSFKFLWSPLMDRYEPPFLGRRRSYIVVSQVGLLLTGLLIALVSDHPERLSVIAALCVSTALLSATQDIAIDAYAVEVLHQDEHGLAVGSRVALYRMAMNVSGGAAISFAALWGWGAVNILIAALYLPCLAITLWADEPEVKQVAPTTLREAVWEPFLGLLSRPRAIEILMFVILFKLGEAFAQSLQRPFFLEIGFNKWDVGLVTATLGSVAIMAGAVLGGMLTNSVGLGRALWITGGVQAFSNLGYAGIAVAGPVRWVLYTATIFEYLASGLGTGTQGVLLLRLTQKRFSATQYALLSSLFALPRIFAGPPSGIMADTLGWRNFFIFTVFAAIPGLVMLQRFVPLGGPEPTFEVDENRPPTTIDTGSLARLSIVFGILSSIAAVSTLGALEATKIYRKTKEFPWIEETMKIAMPDTIGSALWLASAIASGFVLGVALAAMRLTDQKEAQVAA